ncbi:glycosyltransferase family 2 protein [Ornithinimicrobium avium]|uniref:Glycosyltransferase family 2 protein n=1 Tax=Ornithinimicrobium avium TaxID=2283195 RepID=A0A345NQV9_9MICO|nr:galactosyltransferase-related protein [Ornithinimicrobium avium]AXH97417.1 glycosyltransferase family 2 protein [Ornithinimicrobium avium]
MTGRTAVVTIAHGRHEHLAGLMWGLRRQVRSPDVFVAVAMDDPGVLAVVEGGAPPAPQVAVPSVPSCAEGLPLAAARNAGARAAVAAGADTLIFLDVDCIPSPGLVQRYDEVLAPACPSPRPAVAGPVVAAGEVAYLPAVNHPRDYRAADLAALARPHPARPALRAGEVRSADDLRLFWSLSFGIGAADWQRLGGFDEGYVGYGAEDTDFGQRLGAAGGRLLWVGGAAAYHQHHPSSDPPVHHLDSIVANANRFHRRWGWFPMEGWLARFAALGLADQDPDTGQWRALHRV